MPSRKSRFLGSLLGVRITDALGMPFENLTPEHILGLTGPEGVTTFWNPQQRTDAPAWAQKLQVLSPGDYTDDWQLTQAGARSLSHCGRVDLIHLAQEYVTEMHRSDLGWGGTTKRGVLELSGWLNSDGTHGRIPGDFARFAPNAKPGEGCGNGVAMRIAPFGLWSSNVFRYDGRAHPGALSVFQKMIWDVGGLTHPDPRATIGAYAVASLIAKIVAMDRKLETEDLLPLIDQAANEMILMEMRFASRVNMPRHTEGFSERFGWVKPLIQADLTPEEIRQNLGTSCYTLESVPFSIATFLRHPTDFRAALKEAVEAGGDTDTNAAIVGSLVGANVGLEGIPPEWRNFRPDFAEAEHLGHDLYHATVP